MHACSAVTVDYWSILKQYYLVDLAGALNSFWFLEETFCCL
uniref:Uncharacterized protein n=1 Tax=Anguilla anguilla TaxID=7936 RepID=A0A0E9PDE1_ANGAN